MSELVGKSMGCQEVPIYIGVGTGIAILCVVLLLIVINRKWETIKYCMFMKWNFVVNDDPPENIDNLEFDAFVAYR